MVDHGLRTVNQNLRDSWPCVRGYPVRDPTIGVRPFCLAFMKGPTSIREHTEVEKLIEHVQHPSMNLKAQHVGGSTSVQSTSPVLARIRSSTDPHPELRAGLSHADGSHRALDIMESAQGERYGDTPQGRQLLMARRLVERGVRFVSFGMARGALGQP